MSIETDNRFKTQRYRCAAQKCGAHDTGRFFDNEPVLPAINCWKCGAGRGLNVNQMLTQRTGMFPEGASVSGE